MIFSQIIKRFDNYLGNFFSLETNDFIIKSSFHSEKLGTKKQMSNLEWKRYIAQNFTNRSISNSSTTPPPIKIWLQTLVNKEKRKFYIFDELSLILKNKYSNILEIGSGNGYIGYFLNLFGTNVVLSEAFKIKWPLEKIKNIGIKYKHINFLNLKIKEIYNYDLILMSHVDYVFNSSQIKNFIKKCSKRNVDIILIGTSIMGPINFLKSKLCEKKNKSNKFIRVNGFKRTFGRYRAIGKLYNYRVICNTFKSEILEKENWCRMHFIKNN
jgi:hypothetical protein